MNNPFGQIGELKKMRDQAMMIQRQLEAEVMTISHRGIDVDINGAQKILELRNIEGKSSRDVCDAVNEAIKKSQESAAKKLQSMAGGMGGLGSLLGGGK
jgi:DNA-binding protein YbaB